MIRINLLPAEDRSRPRTLPLPGRISLIVYGLVCALLITGVTVYFQQNGKLSALHEKKRDLAEREKVLAEKTRAIERLELQNALLEERVNLLRQLEVHRFENVEWLNALNGVLPGKLWLLKATRNQDGGRSTLEGVATGYQPISRLMRAMEDSGRFAMVQLVRAERTSSDKSSVIHFTVASDWVLKGQAAAYAAARAANMPQVQKAGGAQPVKAKGGLAQEAKH